jgi:hypothetical protein
MASASAWRSSGRWTGFHALSRDEIVAIVENLLVGKRLEQAQDLRGMRGRSHGDPQSAGDLLLGRRQHHPPAQALAWIPTVYRTTAALKKARQRIVYLVCSRCHGCWRRCSGSSEVAPPAIMGAGRERTHRTRFSLAPCAGSASGATRTLHQRNRNVSRWTGTPSYILGAERRLVAPGGNVSNSLTKGKQQ